MLATLLTLTFAAAALLALGVIAASLAKGFAAAAALREELAALGDGRAVTVRHGRIERVAAITPARATRRTARPIAAPAAPVRQRAAA